MNGPVVPQNAGHQSVKPFYQQVSDGDYSETTRRNDELIALATNCRIRYQRKYENGQENEDSSVDVYVLRIVGQKRQLQQPGCRSVFHKLRKNAISHVLLVKVS